MEQQIEQSEFNPLRVAVYGLCGDERLFFELG